MAEEVDRDAISAARAQVPQESQHKDAFQTTQHGLYGDTTEQVAAWDTPGAHIERQMSLKRALQLYPKAIFWSMFLSLALIMEGYDISLINAFFAYTPFQKRYGEQQPDGTYQISAPWQTGLANGALCGEIIGLAINGYVSDRWGYRKVMAASLIALIGFIFIPFFAQNLETLLAGFILQGIPWGIFQTLTTAYASEVCPTALRAYLTIFVNFCWAAGFLIGSGVLKGLLDRPDEWAYRIPYAIQWVWPVPLVIGTLFAPESPWWLIRKNRLREARASLRRLTTTTDTEDFDIEETIAMMIKTNQLEIEISSGTSYLDCFRGVDLRRTEIACLVWMLQILCGSGIMSYSTYFFEQAGLDASNAFALTTGQYALGAVGTLCCWWFVYVWGRRTIYLAGLVLSTILLLVVGFVGLSASTNADWGIGALMLIYTFLYDSTIGPVCYSLVAEVSSTRLRAKTIVLARTAYNITNIINNTITPRMLNPSAWNWGTKGAFFWSGICLLCVVWTFFRLPEPRGRTYAEMDKLFEQKVSARKFSTAVLEHPRHVEREENKDE